MLCIHLLPVVASLRRRKLINAVNSIAFRFSSQKASFFLLVFTALVLCTVRCTPILLLITATDWQLSRVHANPLLSRVNAILHTIYVCICLEQGCACVRAYQTYLRTTVSHFRSVHNQIFYASKKKKLIFYFCNLWSIFNT